MYFVRGKTIAARVQRLRRTNRMTQQELADILGIGVKSVSRMENAQREITLPEAVEISRALHVSLDYLAGLESGYRKVGT